MNQPQFWCQFCETKAVRVLRGSDTSSCGKHKVEVAMLACLNCCRA